MGTWKCWHACRPGLPDWLPLKQDNDDKKTGVMDAGMIIEPNRSVCIVTVYVCTVYLLCFLTFLYLHALTSKLPGRLADASWLLSSKNRGSRHGAHCANVFSRCISAWSCMMFGIACFCHLSMSCVYHARALRAWPWVCMCFNDALCNHTHPRFWVNQS